MKILFVVRTAGFVRNFEHVLRELAARGHEVTIAVERRPAKDDRFTSVFADLAEAGIVCETAPNRMKEPVPQAATQIRLGLDYLRYLDPALSGKTALRERAAAAAPAPLVALLRRRALRQGRGLAAIELGLRALDQTVPPSEAHAQFLAERQPDVVLVTPLVELGAPQTDLVRAARAAGIPTILAVASWDNLTMKGRLREWPDEILVWNEAQREEGQVLHGLPAERIVATGAHTYDHWFEWQPERTRDEFLAEVGLPDRPFLLYLCSSSFIAPDEARYVRDWLTAIRASEHELLREAPVLIRPHPQHSGQWKGADLSDLGPVSVWPRAGADPIERRSRQDFFESMHFCRVVVGINTSALIESAIVGREVLTVLEPRFAATQGGTVHFEHLARAEGGVLTIASDQATHLAQLAARLEGATADESRRTRFLEDFIRPHGLGEPAAPRFADRVEAVVAAGQMAPPPAVALPAAVAAGLRAVWRSPVVPLARAALRRAEKKRGRREKLLAKGSSPRSARQTLTALPELAREMLMLVGDEPPRFGTERLVEALREGRSGTGDGAAEGDRTPTRR